MAFCKEDQGVILFCSQFVSGSIDISPTTIIKYSPAHADSCFHILMMVNEATDLSLGLFRQDCCIYLVKNDEQFDNFECNA